MPRPAKLGILLLLGMAGLLLVLPFALTLPRPPSTLYVHIDGLDWTNVTVQLSNLPQPQRFDRSAQDVRVYPVSHGVYRIGVQLADGQSVWSKFFHYDAGVRQRVDVFLAPSSKPGSSTSGRPQTRRTCSLRGYAILGATEQQPFCLDWI